MSKSHTQDIKESLVMPRDIGDYFKIRIEFRDYFGTDITEAEAILRERGEETERAWNQTLVSNGVI